ncbi:homoserine kinase [Bacillus dakarensis]|uniref:homoserine kinase n=1 Tax=Robertmurraya dakarensis TaxID=1926278 RepID=UPI000981E281|nr:homoserine kinase [Bacillus dakarensis]
MGDGDMLTIQVPGSTANLGPGFDSIGLAVNRYLRLEVEKAETWELVMLSEELNVFPKDESNFIIQVAISTAAKHGKTLPSCKIKMESDIPLTRGLGSSAAAIIAGIELADAAAQLNLSKEEKFQIASKMEGHPDNVGASLYGGLVIGSLQEDEVFAVVNNLLQFDLVTVIPTEELLTKESRNVLPNELPFAEAVKAGSIGNVMVAALLSGDYRLAGKMMRKDLYHQPYRRKLVPHLEGIEELAYEEGAYGVALSGAGPTVICFCESGHGQVLLEKLKAADPGMEYTCLQIDQAGSQVTVQKRVKQ